MQERFKQIFEGFNEAHGYTYKTGERDDRGKEKVKSGFERKIVTDECHYTDDATTSNHLWSFQS
jgi:guanyl-specific ribonuclease Sa